MPPDQIVGSSNWACWAERRPLRFAAPMDDSNAAPTQELVAKLDSLIPRASARVQLSQYGGGPDENCVVANRQGFLQSVFLGALVALFAVGCNRQSFTLEGDAMKPTIGAGERITVDFSAYRYHAPRRWDVVAFHPKPERFQQQIWFMRVVGLPHDRIAYSGGSGNILIDDKVPEQSLPIRAIQYTLGYNATFAGDIVPLPHPFTVAADSYYVLGDNHENAYDSRYWGALPKSNILGKVLSK